MAKRQGQLVRKDKTVTLATRLDVEDAARLQAAAAERGVSTSGLLGQLVRSHLDPKGSRQMPPKTARKIDTARRDRVIAAAVGAHKFSEQRASYWRERWDRDPVTTESLIGRLEPGVDPVIYADAGEVVTEAELDELFPGRAKRPEPPPDPEALRPVWGNQYQPGDDAA